MAKWESTTVTLRPATSRDEPFLYELISSILADQLKAQSWDESVRGPLLQMQYRARSQSYTARFPGAEHNIILVSGVPAGRMIVFRSDREIRLVDIAIASAYRRTGIGGGLIRELLEESDRSGKPVRLTVALDNPALSLYQRLGFVRTDGNGVQQEMERAPSCR